MDTIVRQLLLTLMVTIGIAQCEPALNTQYGVPGNYAGSNNQGSSGGNSFGNHHYDNGNDNDYVDQPMSYEFGYAVKDQATGNDFGRRESSDGETVRGEYRVQLPDGRTQIVTYTADWRTGFHADVRYEGTATYPDDYNNQNNGGYNNNNNAGYNNNQQGGQAVGYQGNSQQGGQAVGYQGNNVGTGFNGGNNGGYNYQASNGNYNNNNNNQYQYQFGSNSLDNSYNNFGARNGYNTRIPSSTYGPAFN